MNLFTLSLYRSAKPSLFFLYAFERKINDLEKQKLEDAKDSTWLEENRKNREGLAERYKERVNKFIQEMSRSPIKHNDHYSVNPEELKEKKKIIGEEVIRFANYRTEKERISNTLKENEQRFESTPLINKRFELRKRDINKEVGPQFRFTAKCTVEKVYDQINAHGVNFVQANQKAAEGFKKNLTRELSIMSRDKKKPNFANTSQSFYEMNKTSTGISPRNLLPSYHKKTHFNAATSVFLQNMGSLANKKPEIATARSQNLSKSFNIGTKIKANSVQLSPIRKLDYQNNSFNDESSEYIVRNILKNCNIIREKHYNGNTLHMGEGMVSSSNGLSNTEVYEKIRNKSKIYK